MANIVLHLSLRSSGVRLLWNMWRPSSKIFLQGTFFLAEAETWCTPSCNIRVLDKVRCQYARHLISLSLSLFWKTASNLRIPIVLSLIFLFTYPWLKKKEIIHVLILSHRFLVHTIFILVLCPLECLMYLFIYHPKTATFYHILEEIYTSTNGKTLVYCLALSNYIFTKIIIKNLWWKNWNQTAKIMEV